MGCKYQRLKEKTEGFPPFARPPPDGGIKKFPPGATVTALKRRNEESRSRPKSEACLDRLSNAAKKGPDGAQEGEISPW